MRLAEGVQYRFLGVVSHSRGADLMDRHAWHFNPGSETNILCARSFEHFCNGHAGVVVHAHAPGADFGDNVISFNLIGTNNVRTDENDLKTTGIYLGSLAPQTITVKGNQIHDDYYGIFTSGPVTLTGKHNQFHNVTTKIGTFPTF